MQNNIFLAQNVHQVLKQNISHSSYTRFAYLLPAKKVTVDGEVPLIVDNIVVVVAVVVVVVLVVEPDIEQEYSTLGLVEI